MLILVPLFTFKQNLELVLLEDVLRKDMTTLKREKWPFLKGGLHSIWNSELNMALACKTTGPEVLHRLCCFPKSGEHWGEVVWWVGVGDQTGSQLEISVGSCSEARPPVTLQTRPAKPLPNTIRWDTTLMPWPCQPVLECSGIFLPLASAHLFFSLRI